MAESYVSYSLSFCRKFGISVNLIMAVNLALSYMDEDCLARGARNKSMINASRIPDFILICYFS